MGRADHTHRSLDARARRRRRGALRVGRPGGSQLAAGLTAATFTALAIIAILWGLVHVVVGLPMRRRRRWSRLGALMLGSVDLALLPYGTALGAYALWTLLSEEGKSLFEDDRR